MHRIARGGGLAALALTLGLVWPAAVSAAPSEDNCAAYRTVPFARDVPADLRTPGLHHLEWHGDYELADGTVDSYDSESQITIDPDAAVYKSTVLVRLNANRAVVDGEVVDVDAMRPSQAASFVVVAGWPASEPDFALVWEVVSVRYELAPGAWSAWLQLAQGPESNFCTQDRSLSRFIRAFGWS